MELRTYFFSLILIAALTLVFFQVAEKVITAPWIQLALNPEINETLMNSIDNQKKLAKLDPERADTYKAQFQQTRDLLQHVEIMQENRTELTERYRILLFVFFGACLFAVVLVQVFHARRVAVRLEGISEDLQRLAIGDTKLKRRDQKKDLLGRIGAMIEHASVVFAGAQQRLKTLDNLQRWQESSRRIAHEIKTPLTIIRLEMKKLYKASTELPQGNEILTHVDHIATELKTLGEFTDQYTSFGKIGTPKFREEDLKTFLESFVELHCEAWPELELGFEVKTKPSLVSMDRRLIRQVLVNLCNNGALAMGPGGGRIDLMVMREGGRLVLNVMDDGPGVPEDIRNRLFEPYATTRDVGKGMGLGLAISRKIMLDHDGDLELLETSEQGTTFQLIFAQEET